MFKKQIIRTKNVYMTEGDLSCTQQEWNILRLDDIKVLTHDILSTNNLLRNINGVANMAQSKADKVAYRFNLLTDRLTALEKFLKINFVPETTTKEKAQYKKINKTK